MGPRVEISADALIHNFETLSRVYGDRPLFPVIKANAYGHGSDVIALTLERFFDATRLPYVCVARLGEAVRLRQCGVRRPILVLSQFDEEEFGEFPSDTELVVSSRRDLDIFRKLPADRRAKVAGIQIEIDTGMHRTGFGSGEEAMEFAAALKALGLSTTGLMSHLARGEEDPALLSAAQCSAFGNLVKHVLASWGARVGGAAPKWIHVANSPGILRHQGETMTNAARPGLHLYGAWANCADRALADAVLSGERLKPVMRVKGPLRQIQVVPAGDGVGYGHRFRCTRERLIGTFNLGYADGVPRSLSRAEKDDWTVGLAVEGHRVPFAGTVSMDLVMVDLSDHPKANEWRSALSAGRFPLVEAEWLGPGQPVEDVADALGTISYEVFCALPSRLPRVVVPETRRAP